MLDSDLEVIAGMVAFVLLALAVGKLVWHPRVRRVVKVSGPAPVLLAWAAWVWSGVVLASDASPLWALGAFFLLPLVAILMTAAYFERSPVDGTAPPPDSGNAYGWHAATGRTAALEEPSIEQEMRGAPWERETVGPETRG